MDLCLESIWDAAQINVLAIVFASGLAYRLEKLAEASQKSEKKAASKRTLH